MPHLDKDAFYRAQPQTPQQIAALRGHLDAGHRPVLETEERLAAARRNLETAAAKALVPPPPPSPPPHDLVQAGATSKALTVTEDGCPATRKPYHVVMTAATGNYQEWQSRIAYYHYQKQKRLNPCSDLGGFTRLFNTYGAQPDSHMDEIPTLLVHQLKHGNCDECDFGFVVMNRPWGVVQLIKTEHWKARITEEYVLLCETDHMFMVPPPNAATPDRPVGFKFYYMTAMDPKLNPVVKKFLNPDIEPETVDQVGPSPIIIHKPLLEKVARPWWDMSVVMKRDSDANRVFGWVLEMWGYNIAVRNMGYRHTVWQDLQVEPQGTGTDDMEGKMIYHYTFGLTVSGGGRAWRIDKRQYYGGYPVRPQLAKGPTHDARAPRHGRLTARFDRPLPQSDHLQLPPACTAKSGFIMAGLWNEAAQNIKGWPNRQPPQPAAADGATPLAHVLAHTSLEKPGLGEQLRGTGPWAWGKLEIFFYSRGVAHVPSKEQTGVGTHGKWAALSDSAVQLVFCGDTFTLTFKEPGKLRHTKLSAFTAKVGSDDTTLPSGRLTDRRQFSEAMLPSEPALPIGGLGEAPAENVAAELAGSGPWKWAGSGPFGFMRGGALITPWGQGRWGTTRSTDGGVETAPTGSVFADFVGAQHTVSFSTRDCLRLQSVRKSDREKVGIEYNGPVDNGCRKGWLLQSL